MTQTTRGWERSPASGRTSSTNDIPQAFCGQHYGKFATGAPPTGNWNGWLPPQNVKFMEVLMHFKRIHPSRFGMVMRYAIQIHILPFAIRRSVNRRDFLPCVSHPRQSLAKPETEMQTQWQLEDVASVISCSRNVNHISYMVLEPFYHLASSWHMLKRIHKQTRVWATSNSNQFPVMQVWDCSQWLQILYIFTYTYVSTYINSNIDVSHWCIVPSIKSKGSYWTYCIHPTLSPRSRSSNMSRLPPSLECFLKAGHVGGNCLIGTSTDLWVAMNA